MPGIAAELALPERGQSRRRFDRAAPSFASASFVHDEARRRLLARLAGLRIAPGTFVDLGAALSHGAAALAALYPAARVVALDSSREMLRRAVPGSFALVAGDVSRLPLPAASADLLFANLVLPWTLPETLFAEARRVLKPEGALVFSTLGPDSLIELRQAWRKADDAIHVHAFWDMQTLGDLAVRAGLEEPVLDVDRLRVSYTELSHVIRDLRACGATNTALGRRRGLTGRGRWHRFAEALWQERQSGGQTRLNLTVELIFGQAFGARSSGKANVAGEIAVPLASLGKRPGRGLSR
jgi:malonyl-CoA O-methyltransferase